jgi:hypothetical protein
METNVEKTKVMGISREPFPLQIMLDQYQLQSVEYFNYLGSMITNDVRCAREIKSSFAMVKSAFNRTKTLFTNKLDINLQKKLVKCYV